MARFAAGFRAAGAGSVTLPSGSLYAPAGNRLIVREIHVSNTATTAVALQIQMFTATGTQGAAITEIEYDNTGPTPTGTAFNTHTVTPTITAGNLGTITLAAAEGGAFVFIYNEGIYIPAGTANGIGAITASGTGQVIDIQFVWDE